MRHRLIIFHPWLFGLYPSLGLFVGNLDVLVPRAALGTLGLSLLLASLVWLAAHALLRNSRKSAAVASIFLLLFFSYGRIMPPLILLLARGRLLTAAGLPGFARLGPLVLFAVWLLLFGLAALYIVRTRRDLGVFTRLLNVMSAAVIGIVLANWVVVQVREREVARFVRSWDTEPPSAQVLPSTASTPPDIYYIILDGYARGDVLHALYDYDNSAFLDHLVDLGFYVAYDSRTNYNQTYLSLASSLNMVYLDQIAQQVGPSSTSRLPLAQMIQHSRLLRTLRSRGYSLAAFATGASVTELRSADTYLAPRWSLNGYEAELLNGTPLPILLRLPGLDDLYDLHRDRILHTVDNLAATSALDSPKLVFAHIVAPHPPFVLGPHGEAVAPDFGDTLGLFQFVDGAQVTMTSDRQDYVEDYRDQLAYISSIVQVAIDDLLARSDRPPIIVLQGDHGPRSSPNWQVSDQANWSEQLPILSAYYFPDGNYTALYPSISPVNSFRVVLRQYFDAEYDLLEDRSYFSSLDLPYAWVQVPEEAKP